MPSSAKAKMANAQASRVAARIDALRELAVTEPQAAQDAAWAWIKRVGAELPNPSAELELAEIFALGDVADVDGQTEGTLLGFLAPAPDLNRSGRGILAIANVTVHRLGLMPWVGKKFDKPAQRGTNTMTRLALVLVPFTHLKPVGRYVEGFRMLNRTEESVIAPGTDVLVLDYESEGSNPWPVNVIRDEATQIVPGTYIGAKLFHQENGYKQLAFWAAKSPV